MDILIGSKERGLWKRSSGDDYCGLLLRKLEKDGELTQREWTILELFEAGYRVGPGDSDLILNLYWGNLNARRQDTTLNDIKIPAVAFPSDVGHF